MNKKGSAPMLIGCSIVFIIAIFLFYTSTDEGDKTPGNNKFTIGEEQFKVIETYQDAEEVINFLKLSAILSEKKVIDKGNFVNEFESNFNSYIETCNQVYNLTLEPDDFNMKYSQTEVLITSEPILFEEDTYTYEISPSFKVNIE
jgi:hypothetical protein